MSRDARHESSCRSLPHRNSRPTQGTLRHTLHTTALALAAHYSALVTLVVPQQVPRVIAKDADDDQVLACAVTARAHLIVSGDQHLHSLGGNYQGVRIVTPAEAAGLLETP